VNYWNLIIQIVSEISIDDMVVFAGDVNVYVGRINRGYAGVDGRFGYGVRNTSG